MDTSSKTIAAARRLRREMSLPEVLLWRELRGRKLSGFQFRRQHPIGPYVLDFYCHAARLAVEIDGGAHDHPDQFRKDSRRDSWLAAQSVRVLRLPARTVLKDMDAAWRTIEAALNCDT